MGKETFEYTYSATKQEEIEAIRRKYLPAQEDKMETLRRLDRSAENAGTITAIGVGAAGALIFGTGMSLVLVGKMFFIGIIVGILGMVFIAAALPLYKYVVKKQREKIAPQIMALSEELMNS